jgi:predicted ATPase
MSFSGGFGTERRSPLVGRTVELRELESALSVVRDKKEKRILTVLGAPGVGKSRLVRDFLSRPHKDGTLPRVFRGAATEGGAAFGVFARVLRARFGVLEGMVGDEAKERMRSEVADVLLDRKVNDVCIFLGELLELRFQDSPLVEAVRAEPSQMRHLRRAVLKRFLELDAKRGEEASEGPLVLVFDDLHLADDDSLDLLAYLVDSLDAPVLLVCLGRPELFARRDDFRGLGGAKHSVMELAPLSEGHAAAVMEALLSPCEDKEAVEDLVDAAATLAGGNPQLLEQMVLIFKDIGVVEVEDGFAENERWLVHLDKLADVRLPLTVEDAIAARIASLSPKERTLLEQAATMGGVFWRGGLLAIARVEAKCPDAWPAADGEDLADISATLKDLCDRDYVLRLPDSTFSGDQELVFKHNLEREALLKLVPRNDAKRYHKAIADWLSFKESVRSHEEYMGMLARHRELGGLPVQAAATYVQAADIARERYANGKAAELYRKGLDLVTSGVDMDVDAHVTALHHFGDVLQVLGKNDEALEAFRSMLARAYRLDLRGKGGAAHSRIGRLYRDTGRLDEAGKHLDASLALFESAEDERGIASTIDDIGKLSWLRGDYAAALEATKKALAARRRLGDRRSIALSLNNLGLVYQDSGKFQLALDSFEQALRIRREIGDLVGVTISLNNLGTVAQDQRDDVRARTLFLEAYEVAKETGDRNRIALVLTNLGETETRLGTPDKAIPYLKEAVEIAEELGDKLGLAEAVRGLGKAYLAQREYTKAREAIAKAVELFREVQSRVQLGVALRSLGEVMAAASAGGDDVVAARGHLLQAIWMFEDIGNDVELARSLRVYADLLKASPEYATDAETRREEEDSRERADGLFAKLLAQSEGRAP